MGNLGRMHLAVVGAIALLVVSGGVAQAMTLAPGTPYAGDFVLGPTTPGKWGPAAFGTGATVTYSYMASGISLAGDVGTPSVALSAFMPVGFEAEFAAAFAAWSAVADITFVEVADGGGAYNLEPLGDIRLGGHFFDGPGGVLAHGYYPPANGLFAAGDIHFDSSELWKIGFGGAGFDIFQVAAHEIGHAIGLDHETGVVALMNPFYTEAFRGLLADDIAGAVEIYGPPFVIPEPGTSVLVVLGLGAIGFGVRRKKKAA